MKKLLIISIFLMAFADAFATHNRAGEITYRYITGNTYEITVNIFADPNSPAFRRREVVINYGDGTGLDSLTETIVFPRIRNNIQKRSWIVQHTFPGPGDYTISITDPNRNGGVNNIINSASVPFFLKSLLRIGQLSSLANNSPTLQNDPIDDACFGQLFVHNPGAVDPDGDSLAYRISPSFGLGGNIAPGYQYPSSSPRAIFVDPVTGDLTMDVPNSIGLYNVAIIILEYRNGIKVGEVLRDIQFQVFAGCNNRPPVIQANALSCVEAGNRLVIPINTFDPDPQDNVTISATGEPFELDGANAAVFNTSSPANSVNASIRWDTRCENSRLSLYNVLLRSEDDAFNRTGTTNLTTFKSIGIRVVAPGPTNSSAQTIGTAIQLRWQNPDCTNASGYKVYRRIDSSGYQSDSCQPGVPNGIGYQLIRTINDINTLEFLDDNRGEGLVPLTKYCYLITKFFSDGDESYVSDEVCSIVDKVTPIMTKVSVDSTDSNTGILEIEWTKPDTIDNFQFPPPYRYVLKEILPNGELVSLDSTNSLTDTTIILNSRNTLDTLSKFSIDLFSLTQGKILVASSTNASSIYLTTIPSDNMVALSWTEEVPWINTSYTVYRKRPNDNSFDSIATTKNKNFIDDSLANGALYCYYVEANGTIGTEFNAITTFNKSQQSCVTPIDNIPPCPPNTVSSSDCDSDELNITWSFDDINCLDDIIGYRIYRSSTLNGPYEVIEEIDDPNIFEFEPTVSSIAGCYYVSAVDSARNESQFTSRTCVEYCPIYELPNVFTPNGDGVNDLYIPLKNPRYRYVDSVEFQVYNRWDQLVFRTTDPAINWDGTNMESGDLLSDGVYVFICKVYESALIERKEPRIIKGTVTILNSIENNTTD